jgi:hypothetical protein
VWDVVLLYKGGNYFLRINPKHFMHDDKVEIAATEWLDNGVVVTFKDGRSLFYSAGLLDAISSQAIDQTHEGRDDSE